ncbi:DgyrCDS1923 [Dimorphilus gyrociliatus]|nr:DgyrCDS1923 [Dimorphilus gyrociliatus]
MHIKDLDVRSQVFTTTGLLIVEWIDERLVWNSTKFNNASDMIVEADRLWRPEFAVINGAEKLYEDYKAFRASISSIGQVHWEPGGVFKTMCEIDITYYPFDEQVCALVFGAWSYHTSKMNLTTSTSVVNLDSYKTNGEWEIFTTSAVRNEFNYECCPNEKFSNVEFKVYLRRRHTFYVLNVILPSIMTSVLLLSVFFCTPNQKVQIGVVVLLSFRIFLLNVAGNIPKTSDHIPLLGIYLTVTMAITTLSMVLTVFVLNLHYISDRPVPSWAKTLIIDYMGRCMCMSSYKKDKRRSTVNGITLEKIGERIARHTMEEEGFIKDSEEDFSADWKRMAEVFDRLFFWFFLTAILITTLILFHPLTKACMKLNCATTKT